jgi:hypothetical protein
LNLGKIEIVSSKVKKKTLSPFLSNIVMEFLTRVLRQGKEIERIRIGKEKNKYSLLANDMLLYLKDSINVPPKKLPNLINTAGYIINMQESGTFLYRNNEETEKEIRKIILFTID